jgi:hypothetical protein
MKGLIWSILNEAKSEKEEVSVIEWMEKNFIKNTLLNQ